MASRIALRIVTPEREIVNEEVDEVELPGSQGYLGVLPGHTPLLATLGVGHVMYREGQTRHYLAVAHGFAEVLPDRVILLAQLAERAEDIDDTRAKAALERAGERLAQAASDLDRARARTALDKAATRLDVAARAKARG